MKPSIAIAIAIAIAMASAASASASAAAASAAGGGKAGGAALERGVPVVLDGVVCASGQEAGDGGPLVAMDGVGPQDLLVLAV